MTEWIDGLTNFVGDLNIGGVDLSNTINGALFGAVSAKLGGGDVLEGAAWGAVGNTVRNADQGIFGEYIDEIGAGIMGYGADKSLGGSGLLGAAGGAFLESLNDSYTKDTGSTDASGEGAEDSAISDEKGLPSISDLGKKYGLIKEDGDGTLLGKTLVGAAGAYGLSVEAEKAREHQTELVKESKRHSKELDEEYEKRRIGAFSGGKPLMVVRNG